MQKYSVQVENQIHKIKVDSLFLIRFADTILSQLPRTCFAVLVFYENMIAYLNNIAKQMHGNFPCPKLIIILVK